MLARLREKAASELQVGLGHDMRLSSPEMAERASDGMVAEGVRVLDAGQVATEQLYFLVGSRELDGGAMVTASHNPRAYTGIKLLREQALALSGDAGIQDVRKEIEAGLPEPPGGGTVESVDIAPDFQSHLVGLVDPDRIGPLRVLAYGSDGMAGPMVGPVLERLNLELRTASFEPDGNFPERGPNPMLEENRAEIVERIREDEVDLAIAWDGDADRCFFFDSEATFCDGDFVAPCWRRPCSPGSRGRRSCTTRARAARSPTPSPPRRAQRPEPRRPRLLQAADARHVGDLRRRGLRRLRLPRLLLRRLGLDPSAADAGAGLGRGPLSGRADGRLRSRYFISGEINSEVADQAAKTAEIEERYSDGEIGHLDGVSVDYPDWHFNVRPSNTEPLLRLNLESLVSPEHMAQKRDELLALIRS